MCIRNLALLFCLFLYAIGFITLDRQIQSKPASLQSPAPLTILETTSGYLRQLTTELLFIKTAVFLGDIKASANPITYETSLAQNLSTMVNLYPEFTDPYFFTQSFLAPISEHSAEEANTILQTGFETYPDNFVFRFFHAFNSFRYLNKPLEASKTFEEGAKREGAPPFFAHLAVVFSAHGGHLTAGMNMLQSMLNNEKDENVKKRYIEELAAFEKAITVQNAITAYQRDHKKPPQQLTELTPRYLTTLPIIEKRFVLIYDPPELYLQRPK